MPDPDPISADRLREVLAGTELPQDPTAVVLPEFSRHWPDELRVQLASSLKPAGVLMPIFERRGRGLSVLLTQRSAELKHHASQISFPGGSMEPQDEDIAATALRETHEEVGIAREQVAVIGYLKPMPTITGYAVTPVVGVVDAGSDIVVDSREVEFAFEVPLSFLIDRGNHKLTEREVMGRRIPLVEFNYEGHRIWGATASIILQFAKILRK